MLDSNDALHGRISMKNYKCSYETHNKCENNALCHLCDGVSLYKNKSEEWAVKMAQREANKEAEKNALLKTHKKEKKEGMAFEKRVAAKWNQHMSKTAPKPEPGLKTYDKKKTVGKPRIDLSDIIESNSNEEQTSKIEQVIIPAKFTPPLAPKPKQVVEAKRQKNSGAMWHAKGDIVLDHALMECKERGTVTSRGAKTISIPKEWLEKQEKEAFQEQRDYWYLPFGYKGSDDIYLVKPYDHELELIFELRKAREEIERIQAELDKVKENGITR
jgi:hypothetical protein